MQEFYIFPVRANVKVRKISGRGVLKLFSLVIWC